MSRLEEKTIQTTPIFAGRIIQVQVDEVELPDGRRASRELVKHPGAVSILALTEEQKIVLVRQFRKPLEKTILELPAGKLEPGEAPVECAKRELKEETGYTADRLTKVAGFYTSPGFADEYLHIYQAEGLKKGEAIPDTDEFVETVELTLEEAFARLATGEIDDAKTVVALYMWQNRVMSK
ncbi:NUDIX hydrolase [Desmospora activa]|uniref:ADP-ribose pyrophosphatase n=1 Tax=Desmospora activa DSM 45169 TaxID=1121389 RepID=A0A2T4Z9M4_9BACL|nr:NUDIX hydrolase [Desmospora activa]PTM58590.1 ADP-ribose pyrophosphatase [Desmospora activa DSM 45169]